MTNETPVRPVIWVGPSRKDLQQFPEAVQNHVGYALFIAQQGGKHADAKPLSGFGGSGVIEIITDYRTDTFRAVYTLRFAGTVYVLHVFQKKSKSGSKTPKSEIDLIKKRLRDAQRIALERMDEEANA